MSRGARLLLLLRPYKLLFTTNILATLVASVMDGATFVLLIPFLRALFGQQALPTTGASGVEDVLAKVVSDTDQVKTAVTAALASLLRNVSLIVVYVAILLGLSWRLTLIAIVAAPVLALIIRPMIARVRRRSREQADERGELTSLVAEMVASIKLVRAYVAEAFEAERFQRLADRYRRRVLRAQRWSTLTSPVSEIFAGLVVVLIFSYGTHLALGASATLRPEVFVAFIAVALRLMSPVKAVAQYPPIMAGAVAAADRVFEVLDLPPDEGDRPGEIPAAFQERIEYRRVSFSYDGTEAAVLRDVDLEVRRGQVVAIVGPSGAGKTTLVDLLPRFYEPPSGGNLIDGGPVTRFTRAGARALVGIVSQERSEEHTSELQSPCNLVCRLLLEKKKKKIENDVDLLESSYAQHVV